MSDQPSDAVSPMATEVGQKNSVEVFVNTLEKAARSLKVYEGEGGPSKTLENIYRNLANAFQRSFDDSDLLEIQVKPTQMIYERKVVYENKDPRHSLSKLLYEAGFRMLTFRAALKPEELVELIHILATDFSKPENQDADLYSIVKERAFSDFDVVTEDRLDELLKSDAELVDRLKVFERQTKRKTREKDVSELRRHRSDDIKILNEFQLKPTLFLKSDEEVSRIVKTLGVVSSNDSKERETMERLALMGFHFLLHEEDRVQLQVGRDLIIEVSKMMLQASGLDLLQGVINKITQLQADRPSLRGELQKALDSVFQLDRYSRFAELFKENILVEPLIQILRLAPPSGTRLIVLLLAEHSELPKQLGPLVLKNLPDLAAWLHQEAEQSPERKSWDLLLSLMAQHPNVHTSKFLQTLLKGASATRRLKILRQCAEIGTRESLEVFRKLLESHQPEERTEAYEQISYSRSKLALQLVMERIEKLTDEQEEELAMKSIFSMAGGAAWPWFEKKWHDAPGGFFKARVQLQKRLRLASAALKSGNSAFLRKLLETSKIQDYPPELQELFKKGSVTEPEGRL